MKNLKTQLSFFKASGWLILATMAGGVGMFLVQVVAIEWLRPQEYGLMNTLFQTLNLAMIPALGLQTVFAQQAASALKEEDNYQTIVAARHVLFALLILWGLAAIYLFVSQDYWMHELKSNIALPLWLTLGAALPQLCLPVWLGILQGREQFLWLGNAIISNGMMRLLAAIVLVGILGFGVSGAVASALAGFAFAVAICFWKIPNSGRKQNISFDWGKWLKKIIPLTLGLGSSTFFLGYDMIVVRMKFEEAMSGYYGAAGLCGRGLVIFTIPIAQVMFPKVVKLSSSRDGANKVVWLSFVSTGALALLACLGIWLVAIIIEKSISGDISLGSQILSQLNQEQLGKLEYISQLAPSFALAMTPLCLANVLINNLIAKKDYSHLWLLISVTMSYGVTLMYWTPDSLSLVITMIGFFSCLLLVSAAFSLWRTSDKHVN